MAIKVCVKKLEDLFAKPQIYETAKPISILKKPMPIQRPVHSTNLKKPKDVRNLFRLKKQSK